MIDLITNVNSTINGFVWGLPMMILIMGVGIYLSIRCGFPQFRHFAHIMKNTLGKAFEKTEKKKVPFHRSKLCVLHLLLPSVLAISLVYPVRSQSADLVQFSGCGFPHFLECVPNLQK